ncbi:hypothetical protein BpHYR1_024306 [Brachionus plicatilis]|uniref:Uncharacterized protein n=1 Tax=Brachionus plicatilis TaxID=10195 RepID=A0A3M7SD88_BRAPC|nr:hypothetical protein BpHYR1_024306 [Brachionus plicatilis]
MFHSNYQIIVLTNKLAKALYGWNRGLIFPFNYLKEGLILTIIFSNLVKDRNKKFKFDNLEFLHIFPNDLSKNKAYLITVLHAFHKISN